MRISQIIFLIFLLSSCRTKTIELVGHWHSIPEEDGYWTLEVTDSTTQINKYDVENRGFPFSRYDEEGKERILFMYEEYSDFEIRNDTLFLDDYFSFIKVDEENYLNDHFLRSVVRLNLEETKMQSETHLPKPSQMVPIYIGPPNKRTDSNEYLHDPIYFQLRDVLGGFDDLKFFAQYEADKLAKGEGYWMVINADSSTSKQVIDSLKSYLGQFEFINGFVDARYNYDQNELQFERTDIR